MLVVRIKLEIDTPQQRLNFHNSYTITSESPTSMKEMKGLSLLQAPFLLALCGTAQAEQPRVSLSTDSGTNTGLNTISTDSAPFECQTLSSAFSGKVKSFKPSWGTYCEAFE